MEYDIDYLINLAYEYYYIKNTSKCVDIIDITIADSKVLSNIKYVPTYDKINSFINQIFNIDCSFIERSEQDYLFLRISPLNTTITIREYANKESINDINSEDNKNKQISFLLSGLLTEKLTKHISILS